MDKDALSLILGLGFDSVDVFLWEGHEKDDENNPKLGQILGQHSVYHDNHRSDLPI